MESRADRSIRIIFLIGAVVFFVLPLLFLILQSFAFGWRWPDIFPTDFSLRGWQVLAREPQLFSALGVTMLIGFSVVILNLLLAIPAGKALAQYHFKGKAWIESLLFLPILIPALAVAMGIHFTMIKLGLANVWWGVVLVHLIPTLPYSVRIMRSGYERMGTQWIEQAISLGVSRWRVFWTVSVPFLLPSLRSAVVLAFVISLSQYVLTIMIGGGNVITWAVIYYPFLRSVDDAVIASFSLLFALLPLLFIALFEGCVCLLVTGRKHFKFLRVMKGE